jgi:hypothetical protein
MSMHISELQTSWRLAKCWAHQGWITDTSAKVFFSCSHKQNNLRITPIGSVCSATTCIFLLALTSSPLRLAPKILFLSVSKQLTPS